MLDPSLERITALADLLGNPQRTYPVVLVAGTNGKTSTARMVDCLLRATGLRVGRYTSPHLQSVTERVSLDGEPVSDDTFVAAYEEIAPYLDLVDARFEVRLSFFEVLTAMAYAVFADAPVDVAVVEVGMGGTWDATNIVDPAVAVVTPIGLDHQAYLGDTVEEIAGEKAGIISASSVAVLGMQPAEAARVLLHRCADTGATVARDGVEFGVVTSTLAVGGQQLALRGLRAEYPEVFLPLYGAHQAHNAALALAAVESLLGGLPLAPEVVAEGFAQVTSPGRLEVVRRGPTVLLDVAHNPAGAAALADALADAFTFTQLVGLVGVLADKDARGILEALEPVLTEVVVTAPDSRRALPAEDLAAVATSVFGTDRVHMADSVAAAVELALARADAALGVGSAGVLVTGSVVTVGQARELLART